MSITIGTDIIKISRMEQFIQRNQLQGRQMILAPNESGTNIRSIAGKFAAKEALLKALGVGFSKGISRLTEIEVVKDAVGKPSMITYGLVNDIINQKNITNIEVSISHDSDYAIAFVVCE
ncbi:MAG: holo-ACP synthase [Gilvibacter sp.]